MPLWSLPVPDLEFTHLRMNPVKRLPRRQFLRTTAVVGTASVVPRWILGGPGRVPPSNQLNVAIVGTGGQGITNLKELLKHPDVSIRAICDVAEFWEPSAHQALSSSIRSSRVA